MALALRLSLTLLSLLVFSSCMKQQSQALLQSSLDASNGLGCKDVRSKAFDSLYNFIDQEQTPLPLSEFTDLLNEGVDQVVAKQNIKNNEKIKYLKKEYTQFFNIIMNKASRGRTVTDPQQLIQNLIELEMEDQSTSDHIEFNAQLSQQMQKVTQTSNQLNIQCNDPNPPTDDTPIIDVPSYDMNLMVTGMNNAISTAYQSCAALDLPPIDASTSDVAGITRLSETHPDGIGAKRVISNLSQVQQTHPYIKLAGDDNSNSCFNVVSNPLIYDYGGQPAISNNTINFFVNSGSGTSALGIDCSALVSSAAAAGGLRYKPGLENKAIYIRQNSSKFINASASNFTCYQNITLTKESWIKPGDIAAVTGHVLMIDKVGDDPFGIYQMNSISECNSIDYRNFDFIVAQSSPSKNGIGINKYIAKDYLKESSKMQTLFVTMAKSACQAYFKNTSIKPLNSEWGIIRHKGTPECLAPKIEMAKQSCVSQCQR